MKALLEFNLDDTDDKMAHLRAVKSLDMALALWAMDEYLRSGIKYAPDSMPSEAYGMLQEVRDKLHKTMSKYSIDLDELIT